MFAVLYKHLQRTGCFFNVVWLVGDFRAPDSKGHEHQLEPNPRRAGIVQASSPCRQLTSLLTCQFAAIPFPCQTMQRFGDAHKLWGSFQHAELTNVWTQVSGWRCLHNPRTAWQQKFGVLRPLLQMDITLVPFISYCGEIVGVKLGSKL